jgi:3-hydroxybutyryl-CoA dehydratase
MNLVNLGDVSAVTRRSVSLEEVRQFAQLTGDFEPIHVDPEHARKSPYGKCIAHGVLVLGLMADNLLSEERVGPNVSYGYDRVRFIRPVLVGSTILTQGKIIEKRPDRNEIIVEETCKNEQGEMLAIAHHVYRLL